MRLLRFIPFNSSARRHSALHYSTGEQQQEQQLGTDWAQAARGRRAPDAPARSRARSARPLRAHTAPHLTAEQIIHFVQRAGLLLVCAVLQIVNIPDCVVPHLLISHLLYISISSHPPGTALTPAQHPGLIKQPELPVHFFIGLQTLITASGS